MHEIVALNEHERSRSFTNGINKIYQPSFLDRFYRGLFVEVENTLTVSIPMGESYTS